MSKNKEQHQQKSGRTGGQVDAGVMHLPRYGLQWNGPKEFIPIEMEDGYWTPWHIAKEIIIALRAKIEAQSYMESFASDQKKNNIF